MLSAKDPEASHADTIFAEENINKSVEDFAIPQGIEYIESKPPKMFHKLDEVDLRPPKRYRITQHRELDSPGYYDGKADYSLQNESKADYTLQNESKIFIKEEVDDDFEMVRDADGKIIGYALSSKQNVGISPNESRPSSASQEAFALGNDGDFLELLDNGHVRKIAYR